jgi:hypothetical protein
MVLMNENGEGTRKGNKTQAKINDEKVEEDDGGKPKKGRNMKEEEDGKDKGARKWLVDERSIPLRC